MLLFTVSLIQIIIIIAKLANNMGNDSCEEGNHTVLKLIKSIQSYSDCFWVKLVVCNDHFSATLYA